METMASPGFKLFCACSNVTGVGLIKFVYWGTHRKSPYVDGVVAAAPVLEAAFEAKGQDQRQTLGFTSPYFPSGGFQQIRHIAHPSTFPVKRLQFCPCGHAPTATGNIQIFTPMFGSFQLDHSMMSDIPFKPLKPKMKRISIDYIEKVYKPVLIPIVKLILKF